MSNPNTPKTLTAAWRVLPAADRWQTYQSQLSRSADTASHPWTRRSVVLCGWRAPAVPASAARA
jgi:hypothetical protein